ncbi:MAG: ATP-dependent DNA helicase RecG [Deltaproteobacteria bacterium]|nr:ATP-dependent DNA helicase RecG [Deltaproteobacteria bacterium]
MKSHQSLSTPVQYVKGVGPALAEKLRQMGILTVGDLLFTVPFRYQDRRDIQPIAKLTPGKDRAIRGTIIRSGVSFLGARRKRIYEALVKDAAGDVASIKWFHFNDRYWKQRYAVGANILVFGDAEIFGSTWQFVHPEIDVLGEGEVPVGEILPIYPLTEGLHQKTMRKIIRSAWDNFREYLEPIYSPDMITAYSLLNSRECLELLHFPTPQSDLEMLSSGTSAAHRTLIFEEFFFLELGLALKRKGVSSLSGIAIPKNEERHQSFIASLPFQLTSAQHRVIAEIAGDMQKPQPMNRLLQGDVGSGKTVVAAAAMVQAASQGFQCALMAPTEILAEQHFASMLAMLLPLGIKCALLSGSTKGSDREQTLARLSSGDISLLVGTHALIQPEVVFQKLALVIVDEQHRFGVLQRQLLKRKGEQADVLIMTATPIPRTLAMTLYGDLDVSVIDELPVGRKPIMTRLYAEHQRQKLFSGIRHELQSGRQAYIVCPLIEESEKIDLKNATDVAEQIAAEFAQEAKVALLHGKMKPQEKEQAMRDFKEGKTKILVATSVVEVGVDVPNASVIVIEHAERFGLSQLHQLRGRVGRSEHQSYCILMADYGRSEEAKRRLQVMVETTDGFRIAEEDLAIRGPGEFIGTRQSGLPPFRIANLARDTKVLSEARDAAFKLVDHDPTLTQPQNRKLREALIQRWEGKLDLAHVS